MSFELSPWQKVVISEIKAHDSLVDSEDLESLGDYERNSQTKVAIALPKKSGHTLLTSYIASHEDSKVVVVYRDMEHWKQIEDYADKNSWTIPQSVGAIGISELYQAVHTSNSYNSSPLLLRLKNKIGEAKVVVVDDASLLPREVKDFLFNVCTGKLVLLN